MKTVAIRDFKGIAPSLDEGNWQQGYAKMTAGMDLVGTEENSSQRAIPGVLQARSRMNAGTEAAATNDVTDLVRHFVLFSGDSSVWALSAPNASPRLYKRASGTWTLQRSTAGGDLTAVNGGGLADFGGSLWVAQDSNVARWDGASWTAAYGTFTASSTYDKPMRQLAGKLFIGNGRYIASIDSSLTFTGAALTLPSNATVHCMEVLGDRLYILASNALAYYQLYIWDGISTTFQSQFTIKELGAVPIVSMIVYQGSLWIVAGDSSGSTGFSFLYVWTGSTFQKVFTIPAVLTFQSSQATIGAITQFKGNILFSCNDTTSGTNAYEGGTAGVWEIGRRNSTAPFEAALAYIPAGVYNQANIGGLYSDGSSLYAGYQNTNSSTFQIWEKDVTGNTYDGAFWQSLPIDAGNPSTNKLWRAIRLDIESSLSGTKTVTVSYRVDYASSFTSLKTITTGGGVNIPIGRVGKVIEIKIQLASPGSGQATKVHGFDLMYDNAKQ